MKNIGKMKFLAAGLASVMAFTTASDANAAVTINITQSGSDVLVVASGSVNLDGLSYSGYSFSGAVIRPISALVRIGVGAIANYNGVTAPSDIGTATAVTFGGTGTGGVFGISSTSVFLPAGYQSGAEILSTWTFSDSTLSSIGLSTGSYVYTMPADTVTVNISQAVAQSVPEPTTWGMMILGFGLIGAGARSRRVKTTVSHA